MTGPDYISKVLKPAIDYATSKNMYAIIDLHQIDDTNTANNSGAAATSFWTDIAPQFEDYTNVIYELFNEPINSSTPWATFKTQVQTWIDTVRAAAPDNIIIVPSMSWDQHPGDAASSPPKGTNLAYTAHIYPNNWGASFQKQLATAVAVAPVFITEWGYSSPQTAANWGTAFETPGGWRWRELDRVGRRQLLGTLHVLKQRADHAHRLWHPGKELAGSQGERRLGPVGDTPDQLAPGAEPVVPALPTAK